MQISVRLATVRLQRRRRRVASRGVARVQVRCPARAVFDRVPQLMRVTRRGSQKLFTTPPGKSSRFVGRRVVCLLGTQASPVRFAARTPADSERRHPGWGWGSALGSRHTYWPMGGVIAMACGATNTTRLCLLLLPTTTTTTTTITTTTSYYYYYLLSLTITTTPSCRCATNWFSAGGRRPAGTARDRAAPGQQRRQQQ